MQILPNVLFKDMSSSRSNLFTLRITRVNIYDDNLPSARQTGFLFRHHHQRVIYQHQTRGNLLFKIVCLSTHVRSLSLPNYVIVTSAAIWKPVLKSTLGGALRTFFTDTKSKRKWTEGRALAFFLMINYLVTKFWSVALFRSRVTMKIGAAKTRGRQTSDDNAVLRALHVQVKAESLMPRYTMWIDDGNSSSFHSHPT